MTITVKMKKFTFLMMLAFVCAGMGTISAQSLQEIVYLKNGSVIRGTIIEQVPNESLKIQTFDGSVFTYKMVDVEKISKEQVNSRSARECVSRQYDRFQRERTRAAKGVSGIRRSGVYDRNGRFPIGSHRVFDLARLSDSALLLCGPRRRCALLFRWGCRGDSPVRQSAVRSVEALCLSVHRSEGWVYGL